MTKKERMENLSSFLFFYFFLDFKKRFGSGKEVVWGGK